MQLQFFFCFINKRYLLSNCFSKYPCSEAVYLRFLSVVWCSIALLICYSFNCVIQNLSTCQEAYLYISPEFPSSLHLLHCRLFHKSVLRNPEDHIPGCNQLYKSFQILCCILQPNTRLEEGTC